MRAAQLGRYQRGLVDLRPIYANNLDYAVRSVEYSRDHGLLAYRLSSDIFPLMDYSAEARALVPRLTKLRRAVEEADLHVSNHPSQFVVLSSPAEHVFDNSLKALEAVCSVMSSIRATGSVTLHGGGVYDDRASAAARLAANVARLPTRVRRFLAFENDERCWTAPELFEATSGQVPIVFDNLHWSANPRSIPYREELRLALRTWPAGRLPELHYSEQAAGKVSGAHADYITGEKLLEFLEDLHETAEGRECAVIVEAKKKDVAIARALGQLSAKKRARLFELVPGLARAPRAWMNRSAAA